MFHFTSSYQKCEVNYNIGRASNITLPNNANVELSIYIKFYIYGKSSTTLDRLIFSTGQNIEFIFQMGGDLSLQILRRWWDTFSKEKKRRCVRYNKWIIRLQFIVNIQTKYCFTPSFRGTHQILWLASPLANMCKLNIHIIPLPFPKKSSWSVGCTLDGTSNKQGAHV